MDHRDETGQLCTRHASVTPERLLELATHGSRMPGFHHDAASKLQSLVMALDEISELTSQADSDLRLAVDTAATALRELQQLFTANRALAKAPQRTRIALSEVFTRASERAGVQIRGEQASSDVRVAVPSIIHALALVLDVAAGPSHLGRVVQVTSEATSERIVTTFAGPAAAAAKLAATASEALAIATFAISREGGQLSCSASERFAIELPLAHVTSQVPKS
jgi:hypothetical protein